MPTPLLNPLQVYRNRDYVQSLVDDRVFDALNYETSGVWAGELAFTGCLDAIDDMPAGAMDCHHGIRSQMIVHRDNSAEFEAEFEALIDEILK